MFNLAAASTHLSREAPIRIGLRKERFRCSVCGRITGLSCSISAYERKVSVSLKAECKLRSFGKMEPVCLISWYHQAPATARTCLRPIFGQPQVHFMRDKSHHGKLWRSPARLHPHLRLPGVPVNSCVTVVRPSDPRINCDLDSPDGWDELSMISTPALACTAND